MPMEKRKFDVEKPPDGKRLCLSPDEGCRREIWPEDSVILDELEYVGIVNEAVRRERIEGDARQVSGLMVDGLTSLSGSCSSQGCDQVHESRARKSHLVYATRRKIPKTLGLHSAVEPPGLASPDSCGQELPNSQFCVGLSGSKVLAAVQDVGTSSSEVDGPFACEATRSPFSEVECYCCKSPVSFPGGVRCAHKDCTKLYHSTCSKTLKLGVWRKRGYSCPHHVCYACEGKRSGRLWKCQKCPLAIHEACCPWPKDMTFFKDNPGWALCWRHSCGRRSALHLQQMQPTSSVKDAFSVLPLPLTASDFSISREIQEEATSDIEPPPYTHIRRNEYLIKRKRDDTDDGVGCKCGKKFECGDDCECRIQSMSCSKHCSCTKECMNRPFRKEKRLRIVKTERCGWGAEAVETVHKGDFIIEYIGEVIDDAMCERRLWAMKGRGNSKFYMCEIMKDFIIDATYKGNSSRFLNHSCQPNCKLEKRRVDGETRAGVFALRDIQVGEPLTYDYKYVEFGANVMCCCGAPKCRGAIGEKPVKKSLNFLKWGTKRVRGTLCSGC